MDEKLLQLELIKNLANCSNGVELANILQENLELFDTNFFQTIEAVAQQTSQTGNQNQANWLRNIAKLLNKTLYSPQTNFKNNNSQFIDESEIKSYLQLRT